ncbi:MAG: aminopeptidase [Bacteroidetes bacterium]|nr:MAG: aminopeptidase [Bacteroidota bacterium]
MKGYSIFILSIIISLMSCEKESENIIGSGVSFKLAESRKEIISDINYQLLFSIPDSLDMLVEGKVKISFQLNSDDNDLVLDFNTKTENVKSVISNTNKKKYKFENGHIIIPNKSLKKGLNQIEIEFVSGNNALNRNENFLYTLFVPDRASTVFPCFDQPDLKATYSLELDIPSDWIAVSNSAVSEINNKKKSKLYKFEKSPLISTYHFAFAVGKFKRLTRTKNGRTLNFYHRETNKEKIELSIEEIFSLHYNAIDWMENYTGIPYPFKKLDFVSIPSFPFAGMEHVGAIFYRESKLFLSESATLKDKLYRATLINHETSHMWFGNLVTMKWFDDVWLKEIFSSFLPTKMVGPIFPEIDLDLNFINSHFPWAYLIDRTEGSNPIKQKLDNLNYAGTLYGKIIYDKAPIVLAKLEQLISKDSLQEGLKEYLRKYEYGNADWNDLIKILDTKTHINLSDWSKTWIEQAGMPHISCKYSLSDDKISSFSIFQDDTYKKGRLWEQNIEVIHSKGGKVTRYPVFIDAKEQIVKELEQVGKPDYVLLNGGGFGYGYFELDSLSRNYLLKNVCEIKNAEIRAIVYITLYEDLLNYKVTPEDFIASISCSLEKENEKLNIPLLLDNLTTTWWYLLDTRTRLDLSHKIENELFTLIKNESDNEIKALIYQTLSSIFVSESSTEKFYDIWKNQKSLYGLKLTETDYTNLAYELIVRDHKDYQLIKSEQLARIQNTSKKRKMEFILPAVSIDQETRDKFFESLKFYENRQHEIWVRTALGYLNHPLRADKSIKYLKPSLAMLGEIQQTGDIFFPKNWLVNTVGKYNNAEAAIIVKQFLKENPDYNENLRAKILQYSDILFRAEKIISK